MTADDDRIRYLDGDPVDGLDPVDQAELDELRASLDHLRTRPVDVLARHLTGCLDLFSYRLDAWITSLATRRLSQQRRQTARGIGIGGFGWVVDLAPEPRTLVASPPAGEGGAPLFAARERGGAVGDGLQHLRPRTRRRQVDPLDGDAHRLQLSVDDHKRRVVLGGAGAGGQQHRRRSHRAAAR